MPNQDNIYEWECDFIDHKILLIVVVLFFFLLDYPNKAPKIKFKTPIYHTNVNNKSNIEECRSICLPFLHFCNPKITMEDILKNIFALFYFPNAHSSYNSRSK